MTALLRDKKAKQRKLEQEAAEGEEEQAQQAQDDQEGPQQSLGRSAVRIRAFAFVWCTVCARRGSLGDIAQGSPFSPDVCVDWVDLEHYRSHTNARLD